MFSPPGNDPVPELGGEKGKDLRGENFREGVSESMSRTESRADLILPVQATFEL